MTKENMDDLIMTRDDHDQAIYPAENRVSDELEQAIQQLIYRLRELGPIRSV